MCFFVLAASLFQVEENTTTEEPLTTPYVYETSTEETTEPSTTRRKSTTATPVPSTTQSTSPVATPSPTPCIGGGLNRTDAKLDEECGAHGEEARCIVSNSACTETSTASTWRCLCVKGYAKNNTSCIKLPTKLFSQESQKVSINLTESGPIGQQVMRVNLTEVAGFQTISPTAEMMGSGSDNFSLSTANTENVVVTRNSETLSKSKFDIFVVVSVTVDGIIIRDFIHLTITVTRTKIIEQNIFVIDGTPANSVIGLVCQSCLSGDFKSINPDNVVSVKNDGSIQTSRHINLTTLQSPQTIAYSSYIEVKQNNQLVANITIIIVRLQYTVTLTEDSNRNTRVGYLKLSIPFSINTNEFKLDVQSLTLGSVSLDYLNEQEVQKTFVLTVSDDAFNVTTIIKVQDVNNNAPRFLETSYRFVTVQSAYTDLTIGVVTAVDPDTNADLTYSINPNDKLSINKNGVISVHNKFSPNALNYSATVTVNDGIFPASANVIIDILPATDESENKTFSGTIAENIDAPTNITTVKTDGYENFKFADQSANKDFIIESQTGIIQNARAFDRENDKEREFKYTVVANKENEATCSLAIIGEVTITVTDVNDEPPEFVCVSYKASVEEEKAGKELLLVPGLSTTDKDYMSTVIYSLKTQGDKFDIDRDKGSIKTKVALDRETHEFFDIIVNAYDGVHNRNTTITVHIIDVNDNNPSIKDPKSFIVEEDSPVGKSVGFIVATDIDEGPNAMITFDLVSDGGYFRINQTTGNILVSRQLDRETIEIHNVTVYARDNGDNIRHTSTTVTVTINDVNDNAPVFDHNQDSVDFEENSPCENPIAIIRASDADKANTPNSQIRYSVTSGADYFTVDQISGTLACKVPLDYEKRNSYEITIEARDNGFPVMSSLQTVIIKVGDINDNRPQFVDNKPQIIIRYFSPDRVVGVFKATDMDSGENGKINFSLSGNATEFLRIGTLDGILRTKRDSTAPTKHNYFLNIAVTDNGNPSLANTTSLVVTVEKQTKPSIEFKQQVIDMQITENSAPYSELKSLSDYVTHPKDKSVTFDIIDDSGDLSFSLGESNGMITLEKSIDRELKEVHEFVVRVKINNDNAESDLALVRVQIVDENDNPPLFGLAAYFFRINEKEPEKAPVSPLDRKIMATDADIGDNALVEYTLHPGGDALPFSLKDEGNGIMSVQLSKKVDYEEHKQYRFSVEAFNPNNRKMNSTIPVVIDIEDYNDNYPEFHGHTNSIYTIFVREDTNINTDLKSFGKVTDKDCRENAAIDLTIVNGDVCLFTVNRVEEELFLKLKLANITLDYEKGSQHNTCIIKATDRGVNKKLSSTATLYISITDVNDNAPFINNPDIIRNLSRDAVSKTVVVDSIPASDIDSGENGIMMYRIKMSEHSSRFIIDSETGNITVNTPLLSVQKDKIDLTVIVSDKGVPSLSATAQVTIRLQDDNPRPYFKKSENKTIQEHTPIPNGILAKIKAYDRRDGEIRDCDCTYRLDTHRNDIIIENDTGVIKFIHSDYTLDREEEIRGQIIIGVIAIDKGEPPKESPTMEFKIMIKDINDQVPVFTKIHYTFGIFQHEPNGTPIGEVVAVDLDENPETFYSINITESSVGSVVEIDKLTGKIVKSGNMSLSSAQNVQMKGNVFAQDGKDLKKSRSHAEITITIEFDDKNNHTPVFKKSEYKTKIDWNLAAGSKIVDVIAEDGDVGKEGNITYSIIDGNTREFFSINSSGAVLLEYQLDSSIGETSTVIVELIVKAQDNGIIPKNSNATVIIRINGINPGTCIQGAEHSKQLLNIESERDNWSYALYGLVGALCFAILMSFAFLYKWRTSPVSETTPPVGKTKYFDNPIPYDHLKKRETVEYSHSNESFDPPSRNCDLSDDKDQYQRVTEPEGEARFRRPPDNKHLHSSRPLSFEEPTPDYPVYEFDGKVSKPAIPSTSRTSENC